MTSIIRPLRRRTAPRKILDTGDLLNRLVEASPVAVALSTRSDARYLAANDEYLNLVGYSRDEMIGYTAWELNVWLSAEDRRRLVRTIRSQNKLHNLELRLRTRSGEIITTLVSAEAVLYRDQECILSMITDITDRKRTEELLQAGYHQLAVASSLARSLAETLEPGQIYEKLSRVIHQVMPHVSEVSVCLYHGTRKEIECVYWEMDQRLVDIRSLPALPLADPGRGTQSEVIHTRQPLLVHNLADRLRTASHIICVEPDEPVSQSGILAPMLADGQVLGVVMVQSLEQNHFTEKDVELLSLLSNTAGIALQNARLFSHLAEAHASQVDAFDRIIEGWGRAMEVRNREMEGHTRRVAEMAVALGQRLGLTDDQLVDLRRGSLLHDIGKMVIPDAILLKPGPLEPQEWEIMQQHPAYALHMLQPFHPSGAIQDVPLCHHERWDGEGYPSGLKGEEIPLFARIFSVVDVWDALTSERPYREAWTSQEAIEYIAMESGRRFDPQVVAQFLPMIVERFQQLQQPTLEPGHKAG